MSLGVGPTRILLVGGGAREHALAWKLAAEPGLDALIALPGSAAMAAEPRVRCLPTIDPLDPPAVLAAARAEAVDLVVIGPETPLAAGLADVLRAAGIAVFGPSQAAARIETSKAFCRDVAAAAGVRMARGRAFGAGQLTVALEFAAELAAAGHGLVVKADGLAAGKGVLVADDLPAAEACLVGLLDRSADPAAGDPTEPGGDPTDPTAPGDPNRSGRPAAVIIEERLFGREVSVIAISDGRNAIALPAARDHKRLLDADAGPNTGGMGAYSPVADLPDDAAAGLLATIHEPVLAELARRGTPFCGFLYAGLMLTADGPVLLECNARLGDPEAQVMLPRLAGALGPVLLAAAQGDLGSVIRSMPSEAGPGTRTPAWSGGPLRLPTLPDAAVGIVLAAAGYPGTPERGHPIEGMGRATRRGALVFHAGTNARPGGSYHTNGGRVLTVVGRGMDLAAARALAEAAADEIAWPGMQRRRDIATDPSSDLDTSVTPDGQSVAAAAGAAR